MKNLQKLAFFCCLIVILPTMVFGDCKCEPQEEEEVRGKDEALKYKIVALASILFSSAIGVYIPMLGKTIPALGPDKDIFFLIKAFAAGVILSTGFIHVLPDAFENLTSEKLPENPWGMFPFTGLVAMLSAIGTLMVDSFASSYYRNSQINKAGHQPQNRDDDEENGEHAVQVHTHKTHGHAHGSLALKNSDSELLRHRVISQVLELGIVVHSVIIGISLGASESPKIIKPLIAALTFHQFFEGMGLGGCITQANFKAKKVAVMALFFSLTTPIGIATGIGISKVYDENSTTALIVEGIFNAASAGILIYMSLVDLLAADHMNPKLQNNFNLRVVACVSLLLGAGCMSVLAIWA